MKHFVSHLKRNTNNPIAKGDDHMSEKAVIYARYSSSNQREESIIGQIRDCRSYAEKLGFEVIKEYTDEARTGTTDRRPGFQQMIKQLSLFGKLTVLLVIDMIRPYIKVN